MNKKAAALPGHLNLHRDKSVPNLKQEAQPYCRDSVRRPP